jgi:hypothetical protein
MSKLLISKLVFSLLLVLFGEYCMAVPVVPFSLLKSPEVITSLEKHIGKALPSDYKDFIVKYNGGYPQQPNSVIDNKNVSVRYFFGLNVNNNYDLGHILNLYKDVIPLNSIPIAEDNSGNLIVLSLDTSSYGEIFFWDHEDIKLTTIARSFTDFIDSLVVLTDEDIGLKREDITSSWINPIFLKKHSD